jgi:hypothetical protein
MQTLRHGCPDTPSVLQVLVRQLNQNVSKVVNLYTELAGIITDMPGTQETMQQQQQQQQQQQTGRQT